MEQGKDNALAQAVEALYRQEFMHRFPYGDCRKLHKIDPRTTRYLIPDLDSYFSFIAGYSSSATRVHQRPEAEIRTALPKLKCSFYEIFPQYGPLSRHITAADTPLLFHDLEIADMLRLQIVTLITHVLSKDF